jgi:hypothetical protein
VKTALALLLLTSVAHAKPTIQAVDERLANGVHVIVAPDATVSSVGVFVRHDDCAAALAQPAQIDDELDRIDGFATTSFETSHFDAYTQVPAGGLELALWFEAKRMAKPTIATTTSSDDEYSQIDAAIESALRPHVAIAKDEVRRCTAPERTTIAIVGRVDAQAALAMTRRYFSEFAPSKITARTWRSTFSTEKTIKLHGSAAAQVMAWPLARSSTAIAMVAASRLAKYGIETELRDEQFRMFGDVTRLDERLRGSTEIERRLVDSQLLQKLESLRYRASVLASGIDIDQLRVAIATTDDLADFAAFLATSPALTVEVAP